MKDEWLNQSLRLARRKADFYSGARKILRQQVFTFTEILPDLTIGDSGFTKSKMSYLHRAYLHEESWRVAQQLWERRRGQRKYGSVGFTTYNHFIKNDPDKKSKRASVMGPCIQSVTITLLPNQRAAVDIFYRTTELFKKFPADLVFIRDVLMPPFDLDIERMTFYFANVTIHPMYFVTMVPLLEDPIGELELLRRSDEYFFNWVVKWTSRYVCPEHHRGIAKFAQALRVQKDALTRIDPSFIDEFRKYLTDHHPGHRAGYQEDSDEDE